MAKNGSPGQLALFEAKATRRRRRRYVPTYDHYSAEALRHMDEVVGRLLAQRQGLKPFEGRCTGCGKVFASSCRDSRVRTL